MKEGEEEDVDTEEYLQRRDTLEQLNNDLSWEKIIRASLIKVVKKKDWR